ncbi:hypothetical protein [Celeribacter halophilus]|uniref:hypothetical protein n=1 Tax=Celeribacter halophilus TaxID=576117 RepID=UPI003A598FAC
MYLVAIMDWATRKVLSCRLSNTLDASFCVEALEEAIAKYGSHSQPETLYRARSLRHHHAAAQRNKSDTNRRLTLRRASKAANTQGRVGSPL